jgi:hypothetical protein
MGDDVGGDVADHGAGLGEGDHHDARDPVLRGTVVQYKRLILLRIGDHHLCPMLQYVHSASDWTSRCSPAFPSRSA